MLGRFPPTLKPQRHALQLPVHDTVRNDRACFESTGTIKNEKSTLDLTQRLEKKLAEFNTSENVFKRWILELSSWTTSAICLGAVVGIYLHINGRSMVQSERLLTWTNVLGKIASAALIVPTSEALGQLKWNWFHKSRAMWDFEIFDKASRGPWGAVMLLFRTRGRSLAAMGALLIVLLLAIDSFLQQVVNFQDQWVPKAELDAKIPRVIHYEPLYTPEFQHHLELANTDKSIVAVIREFFYGNGTQPVPFGNGTRPDIPLSCPTSSCKWRSYQSLAVCSRCEEVSKDLDISRTCLHTEIDWSADYTGPFPEVPYPNGTVCGFFLNSTSTTPMLLSGYIANNETNLPGEMLLTRLIPLTDFYTKGPLFGQGSVRFKDIPYPLLDTLIASAPNGQEGVHRSEPPLVHECILTWCIQSLESSYEMGVYTESIQREFLGSPEPVPWPWATYEVKDADIGVIYKPNITLQLPASDSKTEPVYGADNTTVANVLLIFDDLFPSYYTTRDNSTRPLLRYKNYPDGPVTRAMEFNPWQAPNNLTSHMERLAAAMSNSIRSSTSKEYLKGEVYDMAAMVSIHWEWLIFPFALLVLSLIFLISTIIKTSKDSATGVWKTSAMPTLIYGLPEETRGNFSASSTWNSSHEDSKKVRIRLLPDLGWRVSGQNICKSPLLPIRKNQSPPGWI